jgi:hypothetical protein
MRVLDFVQGVLAKVASIVKLRRQSDFACSDCEKVDRCGLPPSDDCIEKAAQAERGWQRPVSRASWPPVNIIAYSPDHILRAKDEV